MFISVQKRFPSAAIFFLNIFSEMFYRNILPDQCLMAFRSFGITQFFSPEPMSRNKASLILQKQNHSVCNTNYVSVSVTILYRFIPEIFKIDSMDYFSKLTVTLIPWRSEASFERWRPFFFARWKVLKRSPSTEYFRVCSVQFRFVTGRKCQKRCEWLFVGFWTYSCSHLGAWFLPSNA